MSDAAKRKRDARIRRHRRIRKKMRGTAERPRMAVFRSNRHISVQIIDDIAGATVASATTLEAAQSSGSTGNVAAASEVGRRIAERAKEKGVDKVVFDRGGFIYHGRVTALADAAREGGLEF